MRNQNQLALLSSLSDAAENDSARANVLNVLGSRKWTAYALTVSATLALTALGAPGAVIETFAEACMLGLPILLGGQAWVDGRIATRRSTDVTTPTANAHDVHAEVSSTNPSASQR